MSKALEQLAKTLNESAKDIPYYVGLVIVDRDRQKILLGKRREDGLFTGPGGGANIGENPKQAAIREAFEEANLIIKPRELKELPSVVVGNGKVCHCFYVDIDSKKANIHSSNDPDKEVRKWEWFSLKDALPGKVGYNRLTTINNAKMKIWGLRKAIVDQREAGIALNTAEQSQDVTAVGNNQWVNIITDSMEFAQYGDNPKELSLPEGRTLLISRADDGVYSALVRNDDAMTGNYGEIMAQLFKMTPEAIVAALQAKEFIPKNAEIQATPVQEASKDYTGLYEALNNFKGHLHIHLQKALDDHLEKARGKAVPVGTMSTWAGGIRAVKHADGWVVVGEKNHGKLMGKFRGEATHKEYADAHASKKDEGEATPEPKAEEPKAPKAEEPKAPTPTTHEELDKIAHTLTSKEYLDQYMNIGYQGRKPSARTKKILNIRHRRLLDVAKNSGIELTDNVKASHQELQDTLPPTLDDASQAKTKLYKSVSLGKVPKKRQGDILQTLKDCNAVVAEMGITFKKSLIFRADGTLKEGDKKTTRATYEGGGGEHRWIALKDISQAETSIMHEIGHGVDYALAASSSSNVTRSEEMYKDQSELGTKFREMMDFVKASSHYKNSAATSGAKYVSYLNKPTEVFARAFEVYSLGKAQKLIAAGKLDKGFVENYMPDIFKDPTSPKRVELLDKAASIRQINAGWQKDIDAKYQEHLAQAKLEVTEDTHKDGVLALKYIQTDLASQKMSADPSVKAIRAEMSENLGKIRELALKASVLSDFQIPEDKQAEYIEKITGWMDYILKNDAIKKSSAWDDLRDALTKVL